MQISSHTFSPESLELAAQAAMPLGYIIFDSEGNGIDCSRSIIELFGYSTAGEVFEHWESVSPPLQPNGCSSKYLFDKLLAFVNINDKVVFEWQHQNRHGSLIPVDITCSKHRIQDHDVITASLQDRRHFIGGHQDIDTAVLRLSSILRSCPICFTILSEDRFVFLTPFMSNFFDVKLGDSFSSLFNDPSEFEKLNKDLSHTEFLPWIPITLKTHHGEIKEMLAYRLLFDETDPSETFIWLIDVTQSRKLEKELKTAKDSAVFATKAKSEFLANMSHEIRTPMNAIIGLTHLVLKSSLDHQQESYVKTIQRSADVLLKLINDILDFSKIEAGRMILEYRKFSLESVLSDISAIISLSTSKKDVDFLIDRPEELPTHIMGDSVRLHQILLNLLSNAVKFTEQGSIRLGIEIVESDFLSILLRFSIADTGIGMTPAQLKGIFEPFVQARTLTTRKYGGTGLGLVISQRIVELMRGEITCQSEPDVGTTFSFTARFGIPLEGEIASTEDSAELRTDALLIGDDTEAQAEIKHYIELFGAKAYTIGTELAAFQAALLSGMLKKVDFIVFDFSNLREQWIPLYKALHDHQHSRMPVFVFTEHPDLESILSELGIKHLVLTIKKSIAAEELVSIIAKIAEDKEIKRQEKMIADMQTPPDKPWEDIPEFAKKARILLVEDNKINQMVAVELLKAEGFHATVADNGRVALERMEREQFDLILMDIQMPEMDGLEATVAIRSDKRFKNIPIIAMTANAMIGDREESLKAGMNDYITKPIDPQLFYNVLVKWL